MDKKNFCNLSTGYVSFVVGTNQVSLYSPSGKCQLTLNSPATSAKGIQYVTLALLDKQILACGGNGNKNCILFDVATSSWSIYSSGFATHDYNRGVVHRGKIYLFDDIQPEVFDPLTKTWSFIHAPPKSVSCACFVSWNDVILSFGGFYSKQGAFKFDPETNLWTNLNLALPPMLICNSGCVVLPNNNILIAGSRELNYNYGVYNVTSNTWISAEISPSILVNSIPIVMGKRVFIMPSQYEPKVMEYVVSNQTFVPAAANFVIDRIDFYAAISVPAIWFSNWQGGCIGVI